MFELEHIIVSTLPIKNHHADLFWLIGSIIPDIDHIFVLIQHRIFSWKKMLEVMRNEDKYNLRFKTKYVHSIFGAIIFSLPIFFFSKVGALYFFLAFLLHLVLDFPDKDEKQYFYPFKLKVRGWLPILSIWDFWFSIIFLLINFVWRFW